MKSNLSFVAPARQWVMSRVEERRRRLRFSIALDWADLMPGSYASVNCLAHYLLPRCDDLGDIL